MKNFVLSGTEIAGLLLKLASSNRETCRLTDVETLCSKNCIELGVLWREVQARHLVEMPIDELASVLSNADQVISLHVTFSQPDGRVLEVEDGQIISPLDGESA